MKRILKALSILMLLLMVACGKSTKTDEVIKIDENKIEVAVTEKLPVEKDVEFKIMHVNDIHGRVSAAKYDGMGLARVSTIVKQVRAEDPNVLFLDAGDTVHGTVFAALSKGESVVKVMNVMGYDATTTGNHDYNYGLDRIEVLQNEMNYPILVSNVINKDSGEKVFKPYIVKTLPNGVKIGIFGLATPETAYKTNPTNVEAVTFENPIEAAKESVAALEAEGVNYIVGLTHLGVDEDSVYTSIRLANEVEGIDLIVDGHSHTTLEEGMWVGDTLIVQSGFYDKNLGEVTVKLGKDGSKEEIAKLYSKEYAMENIKEDPEVIAIIDEINNENEKITSVVVGETNIVLDGERDDVRTKETNLGDLITEAMLDKTGADGVITNGGGIRASIQKGEITRGEIIAVLPFGNYVVVKEITGQDLKDALENGVQSYPQARGAFPHIAGFTFKFDPNRKVGDKVYDVTFKNGEKLDLNKIYHIATNDFMAVGGDKYESLKGKKTINEYESIEEILGNYIKTKGITVTVVDGRIIAEEATQPNTYTVEAGDTLGKISRKTGVSIEDILKENKDIKNPNVIYQGKEIILPKAN
jgi:2',3'-cyclic-nucleotide 2'-phosphodiesterase (5'-nucleotidase family)